jgi:hypothetical protein
MPHRIPTDRDRGLGTASTSSDDATIELLGDAELLDVVDDNEESWAPGEPPPGVPAEEVLRIHVLGEAEPPADDLDLPDDAFDLPVPDDGLLEAPEVRIATETAE